MCPCAVPLTLLHTMRPRHSPPYILSAWGVQIIGSQFRILRGMTLICALRTLWVLRTFMAG